MKGWSKQIPLLRRGGSREATDGVVPKGWQKGRREAPTISIPLLRRGGRPEGPDGVVGHPPAHLKENHPGGSAATPPKEGN